MNRVIQLALVIPSLVALEVLASEQKPQARCHAVDAQQNCVMYGVSIIDLIANREQYDGKQVLVIGFLRLRFEGNGLFLSSEDFDNNITKNGIWIALKPAEAEANQHLSGHYVIIEGTFNGHEFGHRGSWSGVIEKITRIELWR